MNKITIKQLDLELFGGCDYACKMCPQSTGREREFLKSMPLDVFKKVVDDASQYGLEVVSLHGSGEPTMHKQMSECIKYVKNKNLSCYSFTNGFSLNEEKSKDIIESGLDLLRISAIGFDDASYSEWMNNGSYNTVRNNARRFVELNKELGGNTELHFYHLITDDDNKEVELELYKKNWVDYIDGGQHEVWLMHNWAGTYTDTPYSRSIKTKRTCGRPWSPILQVRAGGLEKHNAAVVACCMVLGRDSEAVLGHLDTHSIEEVLNDKPLFNLRFAHETENFDSISYCKKCDQLFDAPESLVWSNIPDREYGKSKMLDMDIRQELNKIV